MSNLPFAKIIQAKVQAFHRDESGAVTLWWTFWTLAFFTFSSIAVDTSQAWRVKAMLQAASDSAAFGGAIAMAQRAMAADPLSESQEPVEVVLEVVDDVLTQNGPPELPVEVEGEDPVEVALSMARRNLAPEKMGDVLLRDDVELGVWNPATREFVPSPAPHDAIRVTLRRAHENGNPEPTFVARIAGFDNWDIVVQSVARTFRSPRAECEEPVLTARARIDVQTNNVWVGICVRATATAHVDTSESWLSDETAGLIDRILLETLAPYQGNGSEMSGTGAVLAVETGSSGGDGPIDLIDQYLGTTNSSASLDSMIAQLVANASTVIYRESFDFTEVTAGATYHVQCNDNQTLYIPGGVPIRDVVILSECPVRVGQDVDLSSTIIISNIDALNNVEVTPTMPSGVFMGAKDQCNPGDGLRVMAFVDAETAVRMKAFDPELFPLGDILASAQREGGQPDAPVDVGVDIDLANEFLTGGALEDLLGICLGAEYLLEVNAFALAG